MKAPRTPSPKRACRADETTCPANSPSASSTSTIISELSIPESVKTANSGKSGTTTTSSSSKRSFLKTAFIWMFCAGLFFFTTESLRYAGKVINYGNVQLDPLDGAGEISLLSQMAQTHYTVQESEPSNFFTETTKMESKKSHEIETLVRGSTTRKTVTRRRLKMGKMRGGGPTTDLVFLNGETRQDFPGGDATTIEFQEVMTNVQIFQPGVGFLPQGTNIILAPGPRRGMGMGGMGGMGGSGSSKGGSKGSRSKGSRSKGSSKGGSKGRSNRFTFSPTFQPSSRPSSAPSSVPSKNLSLGPTTLAPGSTPFPTTLAPGITLPPTTVGPGMTAFPTTTPPTLPPGVTAPPTLPPTLPPTIRAT